MQGKNPTREQMKLIAYWGLSTYDWLVVKDTPKELVLRHRQKKMVTKRLVK